MFHNENVLFICIISTNGEGSGVHPLSLLNIQCGYGWNPIILCLEPGISQF